MWCTSCAKPSPRESWVCNKEGRGNVKNVSVFFLLGDICIRHCILLRHLFFFNLIANKGERETRVIDWWRNARDLWRQKQEARRLARVLLPAFLCAEIYIKRENSRKEAAGDEAGVQTL